MTLLVIYTSNLTIYTIIAVYIGLLHVAVDCRCLMKRLRICEDLRIEITCELLCLVLNSISGVFENLAIKQAFCLN